MYLHILPLVSSTFAIMSLEEINTRNKWIFAFEEVIPLNNDSLTESYLLHPDAYPTHREGKFFDMACLYENIYLIANMNLDTNTCITLLDVYPSYIVAEEMVRNPNIDINYDSGDLLEKLSVLGYLDLMKELLSSKEWNHDFDYRLSYVDVVEFALDTTNFSDKYLHFMTFIAIASRQIDILKLILDRTGYTEMNDTIRKIEEILFV